MSSTLEAPLGEDQLDEVLRRAQLSLDSGRVSEARASAQALLGFAEQREDRLAEARALGLLGHCDRLVSRFRLAHDSSQRAAQLFKTLGDVAGEARALSTQSYVASCLGRNEDAVEAALLCVRLSEHLSDPELQSYAHNNLGVAYLWSRRFDKATPAFEAAVTLARASRSATAAFHPGLNLACTESFRLVTERSFSGHLPNADGLQTLVDRALSELDASRQLGLQEGMLITMRALQFLFSALSKCWNGDPAGTSRDLDDARKWTGRYQATNWLQSLESWVRGELAWSLNDVGRAEGFMIEMVRTSSAIEHEQLACLGHVILTQLHELQGKPEAALAELKSLRRREQQIRADSIESRERLVKWQLEVRQKELNISSLETASRHFERMSLEDPLTGIANRRCLEQRLSELLSSTQDPEQGLSVAVIDVNRFKDVNDSFSHHVGDEVLKKIAELAGSSVRTHDLPARLAGDEFVVVFPNTTANVASQVSQRICAAVDSFDWDSIAPGLAVSISYGISHARADDSVVSLLHRGDAQMYLHKRK
jgi:diguanylate cyclase (GGDEF)-like protein